MRPPPPPPDKHPGISHHPQLPTAVDSRAQREASLCVSAPRPPGCTHPLPDATSLPTGTSREYLEGVLTAAGGSKVPADPATSLPPLPGKLRNESHGGE